MTDALLGRLRWRCRRGMKELDLLLEAWLERRWDDAAPGQRDAFQWLLEQPDGDLSRWLLTDARPADSRHAVLVDEIVRARD